LKLGSLGSKNPGRLARPGFLVFMVAVAAAAHELKVRAPIDQADVGKIVEYLAATYCGQAAALQPVFRLPCPPQNRLA
jgi:hypothetical protein